MATQRAIKPTAIPRVAYDFQDLAGIEVLLRLYRNPDLYEWVELESDRDADIRSLDDIVAMRRDGSVEYYQVKFTVDAERYPLDWDWLLEKSARGRSLLAKWSTAWRKAGDKGEIHRAELRTNRRPSPQFGACLVDGHVDLDTLEKDLRSKVEQECGGPSEAAAFLAGFRFAEPLLDFDRFETALKSQIVGSDTDLAGWLLLKSQVVSWASRRNEPPPDGRIRRGHLVQLISTKRPRPLSQDFGVPDGYCPPSGVFDSAVRARVASDQHPITILWGTPGRGKSTYLSFLSHELGATQTVLRHHYFLPDDQANPDRVFFSDIAHSLIDQLQARSGRAASGEADANDLRGVLSEEARALAAEGKSLLLIVDGLDHVWRDTERTDQLNHLFNVLLPLPANVRLVVGTQRVEDAQLPQRLLKTASEDDWIEIPPMDEAAVLSWVKAQDKARPLNLRWGDFHRGDKISELADALFRASGGHPLYLIYALEGLVRSGKQIDADSVDALPPCPSGDIRQYYQGLWGRISANERTILHMLAGSDFHWPGLGIRETVGDYGAIAFLLEPRNTGLRPFHASLFAWIRERADHEESFLAVLPRIADWLDGRAPDYWRWGWLWLIHARLGDAAPLMTGATRAWAVDSLAQGWPERQIETILAAAERIAFDSGDYAQTLRLRSIKTRVLNAREFQSPDYGLFQATALAAAGNLQQARNLLDDLALLTDGEIAALGELGPPALADELRQQCVEELARRLNLWLQLRHRPDADFVALADRFLRIAALCGMGELERALRLVKLFKEPGPRLEILIRKLGEAGDAAALKALASKLRGKDRAGERRLIGEELARVRLRLGAAFDEESGKEPVSAFTAACRSLRLGKSASFRPQPVPHGLATVRFASDLSPAMTDFFADAFWSALALSGQAAGALSFAYPPSRRGALGWAGDALGRLEELAQMLATSAAPNPGFATMYEAMAGLAPVSFSAHETVYQQYAMFRDAMLRIACDLHWLGGRGSGGVTLAELDQVRRSPHWSDERFLHFNLANRVRILEPEAAAELTASLAQGLSEKVTEFRERSGDWANLASFALLYGVGDPEKLVRRSADCLLGYFYRKDFYANDVLSAIRAVHERDPSHTRHWLRTVTPIVDRITDFTDGDETDHVRSELMEVVGRTVPEWLSRFHRKHLDADEWRYADECLEILLGHSGVGSPEARALCSSVVDRKSLAVLGKRSADDAEARAALERQSAFLGGIEPLKDPYSDTTPRRKGRKAKPLDLARFGPKALARLLKAAGHRKFDYGYTREVALDWLRHWHAEGRGREALKGLEDYLAATDYPHEVETTLDEAFRISLALDGPEAAYEWLVRAHVQRNGWAPYWASETEVLERLEEAARNYGDRWRDYVRDSGKTRFYWLRGSSFAIGQRYLVSFLLMVGEQDLAIQTTEQLVATLVDEVADQPIGDAFWLA